MSAGDRFPERGGHVCGDVTMNELAPPPEWLMQRSADAPEVEPAEEVQP